MGQNVGNWNSSQLGPVDSMDSAYVTAVKKSVTSLMEVGCFLDPWGESNDVELEGPRAKDHPRYMCDRPSFFFSRPSFVLGCVLFLAIRALEPSISVEEQRVPISPDISSSVVLRPIAGESAFSIRVWLVAYSNSTNFPNISGTYSIANSFDRIFDFPIVNATYVSQSVVLLFAERSNQVNKTTIIVNLTAEESTADVVVVKTESIPVNYVVFLCGARSIFLIAIGWQIVMFFLKPSRGSQKTIFQWMTLALMGIGLLFNNISYCWSFGDAELILTRLQCCFNYILDYYVLFYCSAVFHNLIESDFPQNCIFSALTGFFAAAGKVEGEICRTFFIIPYLAELGIRYGFPCYAFFSSLILCPRELRARLGLYAIVVGLFVALNGWILHQNQEDSKLRMSLQYYLSRNAFVMLMGAMHVRMTKHDIDYQLQN
jgi:hypothetical protein